MLWSFKKEFAKKRLFKASAGKAWTQGAEAAALIARKALGAMGASASLLGSGTDEEETWVAKTTLLLHEVDDTARKAAKAGGAKWTDELRGRAALVRAAIETAVGASGQRRRRALLGAGAGDRRRERRRRRPRARRDRGLARRAPQGSPRSRATFGPRSRRPPTLDHHNLVQLRRADPSSPSSSSAPTTSAAHRDGFELTDRRMERRATSSSEVDYCLYCHDRDKDSCSKGLRDNKTGAIKPNPLGVALDGCPLDEKISEMH